MRLVIPILATLAGPVAVANTPVLPSVDEKSIQGSWEGLCVHSDRNGDTLGAVRLILDEGLKGVVDVAFWLRGSDEPFLFEHLEVGDVKVRGGKATITTGPAKNGLWKSVILKGQGWAYRDQGWIKVDLAIRGASYRCAGTLLRTPHPYLDGVKTFLHAFQGTRAPELPKPSIPADGAGRPTMR